MVIGVPKEVKKDEHRVAMTPAGVHRLAQDGHKVIVEQSAGVGTGLSDDEYAAAGATLGDVSQVWAQSDLIVKVKEPLSEEFPRIRPGQALFTFFHFAASADLTRAMVESGAICIAYETIPDANDKLPILTPMSEIAGRMSVQAGAACLEKHHKGQGVLLSGVPGVPPASVVIIGGGVVGTNAAKIAAGFGARVTILDLDLERMRYLDDVMPANVKTLYSNPTNLRDAARQADLTIGAIYLTGERTPKLIDRALLKEMKDGSALVDVCVDQGGVAETTRPTTHSDPTYVEEGVVHYAVANMPGAVARTSTYALTNVTLGYVRQIAKHGAREALRNDPFLLQGLNVIEGKVTLQPIAELFGYPYISAGQAL